MNNSHAVERAPHEQVRAKELDSRTDIYALGLVLYEMAGGKRAVHVKTRSLENVPPHLRACPLQFRFNITCRLPSLIRISCKTPFDCVREAVAGIWLFVPRLRQSAAAAQPFSFRIPVPDGLRMLGRSTFRFLRMERRWRFSRLERMASNTWVQRIGDLEAKLLPGTAASPIWSPDSKIVAFHASGKLNTPPEMTGHPKHGPNR